MCGYRILDKDEKPITPFWVTPYDVAKIILDLRKEEK